MRKPKRTPVMPARLDRPAPTKERVQELTDRIYTLREQLPCDLCKQKRLVLWYERKTGAEYPVESLAAKGTAWWKIRQMLHNNWIRCCNYCLPELSKHAARRPPQREHAPKSRMGQLLITLRLLNKRADALPQGNGDAGVVAERKLLRGKAARLRYLIWQLNEAEKKAEATKVEGAQSCADNEAVKT